MRLNNTWEGLMSSRDWILNFKDTNKIRRAGGGGDASVLLFSSYRRKILLWAEAGPLINNQEKVATSLDTN